MTLHESTPSPADHQIRSYFTPSRSNIRFRLPGPSSIMNALFTIAQRLGTWFKEDSGKASSTLITLPAELLTEILKLLAWKDVLQVRGVCRFLAEATRTRYIWTHLVNEHVLANPHPPRLERPIETYSSQELEHLLLLWKSADRGLEASTLQPSRERTFVGVKTGYGTRTGNGPYGASDKLIHLIKGGRWLLVVEQTGAVSCYDLDAETISGVRLIPDQMEFGNNSRVLMTLDYATHSPVLEFAIALSLQDGAPWEESLTSIRYRRTVQIWRVDVALDDTRHAVGLTATFLASFPHRPEILGVMSLSLLGPMIAFTSITDEETYAFVVDWTQANGNSLEYPWRVVQRTMPQGYIHLLPGSRLLVASSNSFSLCDYSITPETTSLPDSTRYSFPVVWQVKGHTCMKGSGCLLTKNTARIVLGNNSSLITVSFNNTPVSNEMPDIVPLPPGPTPLFYAQTFLGHKYIIAMDMSGYMTIMSYTSPGFASPGNPTEVFRKYTLFNIPTACEPHLDEDSGRIVYVIEQRERGVLDYTEFAVLDFAMIFKQ
ncbi:hypothetical protein CVT25_000579 [Psilocybe cyanescens]|uniref:F-box domain-containing protein n=1 Tax=Psilocybe cyanescens TaxID=93625 RepID=A0A409WZS6_PSICY|nr:hypothetical protein CVT25_000579 [Psilocybe cyanescens]